MLDAATLVYDHRETLRSMGTLALSRVLRRGGFPEEVREPSAVSGLVPSPSPRMLAAFLRATEGEPSRFVPPTFYVTWGMGALAQSLLKLCLPYDYSRVLHSASEVRYARPLSRNERAAFSTRVVAVDDGERRTKIRVETAVCEREAEGPEIFRHAAELYLPKRGLPARSRVGEKPLQNAPVLALLRMDQGIGRRYALASGDFNPVHWSRIAAWALGHPGVFAQGYCTKAMVAHALIRELLDGSQERLASLQVRFCRPIYVPVTVSLRVGAESTAVDERSRDLAVTDERGGQTYLRGRVTYRP